MYDVAKKFLGYKAVICGNTLEFYHYEKPFYADYKRQYEIQKKEVDDEAEKRLDNLSRARKKVRQIVLSNLTPHTKILTLTYAKTQLEVSVFYKDFQSFLQKMKRAGYKLKYIYVLERQKERGKKEGNIGSIHPHIIIFNDEIIPIQTIIRCWGLGSVDIHMLNGLRYKKDEVGKKGDGEKIRNAGAYMCKYLNKESELEFGSHCYKCSLGLKRPIEHNFYTYKTEYDDRVDYTTDDLQGLKNLRGLCDDNEYSYQQKIRFVTGDGKLCENTIHCTQVQIKPGNLQAVSDFVKRMPNGDVMPEVSVKKRENLQKSDEFELPAL